jgi:long-chain acyl-CoA synthetase
MSETILDRLDQQVRERGDRPAVADPRSDTFDAWDTLSWKQYADQIYTMARAFHALGLRPGGAVTIAGPNSVAWVVADIAAMAAGGVPAGIYVTVTPEQAQYIVKHSRAPVAVASDHGQARKLIAGWGELPELQAIVLFPGQPAIAGEPRVLTWEQALARAEEVPMATIAEIRRSIPSTAPATLIYTSGTTGPPKAVVLTHDNLAWTSGIARELVDSRPGDRSVSYLPLSHIAEQMLSIHVPITTGATVHFVSVMEKLADALRAVQPSMFFGVPRVWEKIQAKVEAGVATAPPLRQKLFRSAQAVGLAVHRARFEGKPAPLGARLAYPLFHKLVYSKLKARLGFGSMRVCATGAAPMSPATRDWFVAVGIEISEVYGQSEDCGPTSFNRAGDARLDTVGRPIPGIEVKIAADGEIVVRGRNVFAGYLHDETATREALVDGWLHTGDVGVLTDGYLRITDRKKDLIITAGGKNVAPQNIERELRELPLVSQAVVIGDRRKYLTALITLVPEELARVCTERGITESDPAARARHPAVIALIDEAIRTQVNPRLAQYETVKRFEILPGELTEEGGELTPTMKIKRKVVGTKYAELIERMYLGAEG